MRPTNLKLGVVVLAMAAALGGCKKKVAITGNEAGSTPEGSSCPKNIGLISDGENANQVADIQGRGGYFYTFVDDSGSTITPEAGKNGGTFSMSPGGANGSPNAARFSGKVAGADPAYAGLGLNFVDPKGEYDASKYKGISFWAKKGPGSISKVRLKVPDHNTDPDGKVCKECFNDFGADLTLTEEWQQYVIPFDSMRQMKGWGSPRMDAIDPKTLYGIQFQVNELGGTYDIYIDDIEFTGCGG